MEMRTPVTRCRITAFVFLPFYVTTRLLVVLALWCLVAGCTRVSSIKWDTGAPLVYHQEAKLHVMLEEGWFTRGHADAILDDSESLMVLHKVRQSVKPGEIQLTFSVVPTRAGNDLEAFVRYGRDRSNRKSFKFNIEMSAFSGRSNASFLEMNEAPDASVYGSHITRWSGIGRTQYISGHAASNVCKKISAAVTDFAISHALFNDEFFVGAGFSSIPEDPDAYWRLAKEIAALPHPKSLNGEIAAAERSKDPDRAYGLADLLDNPESYVRPQDGAELFKQVLWFEDVDAHLQDVAAWIRDPQSALALMSGGSGFGNVIDAIVSMPPGQRSALATGLRKYADLLDSRDLLKRAFTEVSQREGLTLDRETSAPAASALAEAIRAQAATLRAGSVASLQTSSLLADGGGQGESKVLELLWYGDDKRTAGSLDRFSTPWRDGLVFLPFIDGTTGKDITFAVSKALFTMGTSATTATAGMNGYVVLDLFRLSVEQEMISNLEEAASRAEEYRQEIVGIELGEMSQRFEQAQDKKRWLHETEEVTYHTVDEQFRPTGQVKVVREPHFRMWARRLEAADSFRRSALLYRQSARRIRERANDPRAMAINESALLDSFLRGWDLVFVDNSKASPYRSWLASNRTAVWGEIFRQAAALRMDLAPLVSEQTVFQVRDEGEQYRIRPMYVGELGSTKVVKSDDGKLVYYRSPWTQRQVGYLERSDVDPQVWSQATAQFNGNHLDSALETLADHILHTALAEKDPQLQKSGIRHAMDVDPSYTADVLVKDYWGKWQENRVSVLEQEHFERILATDGMDRRSAARVLGVQPSDQRLDRYEAYLATRAFEGGLRIIRCLAEQSGSLEDAQSSATTESTPAWSGGSQEAQTARAVDACFETLYKAELNAFSALSLDRQRDEIRKNLAAAAKEWSFNALGRSLAQKTINVALNQLLQPLLWRSLTANDGHLLKRNLESQIGLEWHAGEFRSAFDLMLASVRNQVGTDEVARRAQLLEALRMDILKALVYSGRELGGATQGKASLARIDSARGSVSWFELPKSDFTMMPTSIERITYRIGSSDASVHSASFALGGTSGMSPLLPGFVPLASSDSPNIARDGAKATSEALGVGSARAPQGVREAVWARNGREIRAVSFSDRLDGHRHSVVVKMASAGPAEANRVVESLTGAGFELLQGKKLPEGFRRAVVFAYPDQVVVVAGDDVLRLVPPPGTNDVARLAHDTLAKGNVELVDLGPSSDGVWPEVRYIAAQPFDPSVYFGQMQPIPGIVTFSRDGDALRALVRDADGSLSSVAVQNGQLRKLSNGAAALRDMDTFERINLARHSDDKVRFLHVSAFDGTRDETTHVQVGVVGGEVSVYELRALINGENIATPTVDALFPKLPAGVRPTVIIYRDAFVRAAGRGGGAVASAGGPGHIPPDGPPLIAVANFDADRDPMKGVYQKDTEHVPPLKLLLALKDKYTDYQFALDDELDMARANALDPFVIGSGKDLGVYLPARSFRVTTLGVMINIRQQLESAGIHVESSMKALAERNILVISGHKDQALEAYIDAHIKAGNLKGKQVVLFSCYQRGDPGLVHRMVAEGGAKEVIFFADTIDAGAVNEVVAELARSLTPGNAEPGSRRQLIDLLDASVEAATRQASDEEMKKKIETLRRRVPQLSAIRWLAVVRAA